MCLLNDHTAPDLSVIVAVFNTADCLEKCLDSLLAQRVQSAEFLLINDGSTDGSLEIMKRYAAADRRFRIIDQENRGFAGARNRGLQEAAGRWIGFVDSDDWIEPEMYSSLLSLAAADDKLDIVCCNYCEEYIRESMTVPHSNAAAMIALAVSGGSFRGAEQLLLEDGVIWNRIYRRQMIVENDLKFSVSMIFGEDVFFYWTALCSAGKIKVIDTPFYHYRRNRSGSQVASSDRRIFAYFETIKGFDRYIEQHDLVYLRPWVNHLRLSFISWGYERLDSGLRREFFKQYCDFICRTMTSPGADTIAFPDCRKLNAAVGEYELDCHLPASYVLRYRALAILHPLMLGALRRSRKSVFDAVILIRVVLRQLPYFIGRLLPKRRKCR